jgi:riboflavin kinase/FMN adenylyltransferase
VSNAVAIGVFDGVHLGHVEILKRAIARARAQKGRCVVISFDPHPDVVLAKTFQAIPALTSIPEKRDLLARLGVDDVEILPFTRELAALAPEEFVMQHVVRPHAPHALVVGENFALGRARAGDVPRLSAIGARLGFVVDAVPLLERDGGTVSSTRIRALLEAGRVAEAARLLGRRYAIGGLVVSGDAIGRTLGVPTANLRLNDEKVVPAHGIYVVRARIAGESAWRPGAMSIGVRPTFGGRVRTLEVHLIDWRGDLLGQGLEVEFVDWLRSEIQFENTEALIHAMQEDIAESRRRLEREAIQG